MILGYMWDYIGVWKILHQLGHPEYCPKASGVVQQVVVVVVVVDSSSSS